MAKILSIIISKEKEKIMLALTFSKRTAGSENDVRILFFGPSESVVASDNDIDRLITESFPSEKPSACVFVAQNSNIAEKLGKTVNLVKAGEYIAKSIDEGYAPITF